MADKKISALPAATTPLAGTEVLPIVQSGVTDKVSVANLTAGRVIAASGASLTVGSGTVRLEMVSPDNGGSNFYVDVSGTGAAFNMVNGFPISFKTANTEAFRVDTNQNIVISTAGKGIDFSANTHAAGMTSELLDWYEEGTWTATMIGSTAAPTAPVTATGYYTRIGNIVHLFASFANVDTTGAAGDLQVTGLPFTAGSARAFGIAALDKFTLTGVQAFAVIYNGDNKVLFSENVNNGYGPNVAIPSTTGVYAQFSITYQV